MSSSSSSSSSSGLDHFLYLTFDDGPRYGTDDCVLQCEAKGVKGTFFLVGKYFDTSTFRGYVQQAYHADMLLGNHSWHHWRQYSNYSNPPTGKTNAQWPTDMEDCDTEINNVVGTTGKHTTARLPGINAWRVGTINRDNQNSKRVADHISANGYKPNGWDQEWPRNSSGNPAKTLQEMTDIVYDRLTCVTHAELSRKCILLMHDTQFRNSQGTDVQLGDFIQRIKNLPITVKFRKLTTYLTD